MAMDLIEELWKHYDLDNTGLLSKKQVRSLIKDLLAKECR